MSWAEVGLIPKAEGAMEGLGAEWRGQSICRKVPGWCWCGVVMELARSLGIPATPCPHGQVLWASAGQLRDPESQGHCVGEVTGV